MVNLKPITKDNFDDVIELEVDENQDFVVDNVYSIAESKVDPSMIPLAIYNDTNLVGFLMYGINPDPDDNNYWIIRLMVDKKFQKNGYGKKAVELLIDRIKEDKNYSKIMVSTDPENVVAINLYKKLGFKTTGNIIDEEEVFELNYWYN